MSIAQSSLGVALISLAALASAQELESAHPDRKAKPSVFDVKPFNDLMLRAVDNSSNNVKLSASPGSYTVYGKIVTHEGKPISGAQVLLADERRGPEMYLDNFDQSDEQGRFVVRSDRNSRFVFVRAGGLFFKRATDGQEDVVVEIPQTYSVSLHTPNSLNDLHKSLHVNPIGANQTKTQVVGSLGTTIDEAAAGKVRLVPGKYKVTGSRPLKTPDDQTRWVTVQLGEISVTADTGQSFALRHAGVNLRGSLSDLDSAMESLRKSGGVRAELVRENGNQSSRFDGVLCDKAGDFKFEAVPAGRYTLELYTIAKPVPNQGRGFGLVTSSDVLIHSQPIEVGEESVEVQLRSELKSDVATTTPSTTAETIHSILRSQHPQPNVSWSWTDVQVTNIIRLQDRTGAQTELLRLITAEDTPGDWRYLSLRALPAMTPLPEDTVSRLAEALYKPAIGRYRGSVLKAIRKMSEGVDAVPIMLPLKDDEDWRLRYSVANALGEIAKELIAPPDEIIATLIEFLDDPHGVVRKEAAGSLGVLHVSGATTALKRNLDDPWGPARALTAWAYLECGGDAAFAVEAMMDLLENGDLEGQREAAYYLAMFDHRAQPAIPLLRQCLAYKKKPPFRNSNETSKYQLRGAAERAILAIEASLAWRDAQPRFELGAAPIDPKLQVGGTIKWGQAVDGLQIGIAIESPQQDFSAGDRVPIVLLIRNLNATTVRLEIDRRLPDIAPSVTSGTKRQGVKHSRLLVSPAFPVFDVGPGETYWISYNGLGLGASPNSEGLWLPYLMNAKPALYSLQQRYRFERYDMERGIKQRIWLTSGNATFKVVGR